MDPTLKLALVAAASAIIGGLITGVIAPHIAWGIEEKKQKRAHRLELITKWRSMIAELYKVSSIQRESPKSFGSQLIQKPDWPGLKAHLSSEVMQQVETDWNGIDFGNPRRGILPILADVIGELEKEWDLA